MNSEEHATAITLPVYVVNFPFHQVTHTSTEDDQHSSNQTFTTPNFSFTCHTNPNSKTQKDPLSRLKLTANTVAHFTKKSSIENSVNATHVSSNQLSTGNKHRHSSTKFCKTNNHRFVNLSFIVFECHNTCR